MLELKKLRDDIKYFERRSREAFEKIRALTISMGHTEFIQGIYYAYFTYPRVELITALKDRLDELILEIEEANKQLACRSRMDYISEKEKSENERE